MRRFLRKLTHDDEGKPIFGSHPTDLAIVFVAFVITCCFVLLMFMPQNWDAIDRALAPVPAPKPPPAHQVKGETQMMIFNTQKK
jgi:hypothetical protein